MDNLEKIGVLLKAEAEELSALRSASLNARAPVSLDQQSVGRVSRIDAMQQQAMAAAQERQRAIKLRRIEQALIRIEQNDFGFCLDCEEQIPQKRLQVDYATELCVSCAGKTAH